MTPTKSGSWRRRTASSWKRAQTPSSQSLAPKKRLFRSAAPPSRAPSIPWLLTRVMVQNQGKREERNKREAGRVVGLPETPTATLADKRTKSEMALEFAQLSTASYGRFDKR